MQAGSEVDTTKHFDRPLVLFLPLSFPGFRQEDHRWNQSRACRGRSSFRERRSRRFRTVSLSIATGHLIDDLTIDRVEDTARDMA
jgi:hypothetical protein